MKEREEAGSALPSALATAIMDALEGKPSAPTLTLLAGLRPEGMPTAPTSLGVVPKAPFPKDPRDPRPRGRSKLAVEAAAAFQKVMDGILADPSVPVPVYSRVGPPAPPARPVPPGDTRCALHKRRRTL